MLLFHALELIWLLDGIKPTPHRLFPQLPPMQHFTVLRNKRLGCHLHIIKTRHSLFKTKERFQSETPPQFYPPRWVGIIDHKTFQAFPLHFCIHSKTGYWVKAWDGGYSFQTYNLHHFSHVSPRCQPRVCGGGW